MTQPVRIQLSRRKGFNLQAESVALNGLPAVNCARPSVYGNPFVIGESYPIAEGSIGGAHLGETKITNARDAVEAFEAWATDEGSPLPEVSRLRGKNLACWCSLPAPGEPDHCHAAVLLRLASVTCEDPRPASSTSNLTEK